jgi:uncharacterized protein (TIGR02646 family)
MLPDAPAILKTAGVKRTEDDCAAYDASPDAYLSGKFSVLANIYGAPEVKRALLEAQFKKCCYCESKLLATTWGDVEHYRPKKCVRQDMCSREEKPGYYWLAYSWSNLLVACEKCNRECKRTQFPLANPERRARSHRDRLDDEITLFVHPALEDPRTHIRFRNDAPEGLTPAGITTIRVLGLASRPDLVDARLKKFKHLVHLLKAYRKCAADPSWAAWRAETRMFLEAEMHPSNEFSSMQIDLITPGLQ